MNSITVTPQKILAVFAHADDETLLAGALISRLVSEGHQVRVLCLAPGDEDRTNRLRSACHELGVSAVETLRYAEGKMLQDKSDLSRERSLPLSLSTAPIADLAAGIGGRIGEYDPDVVVTHSSYGDYGHADHAAVSRAVKIATENAVRSGNPNIRLYLLDWPRWGVRLNARLMNLGGRSARRMGEDGQFDLLTALEADEGEQISVVVRTGLGARRKASRFYSKEIAQGPLPMRLLERAPLWIQRSFLGNARLRLVIKPAGFRGSNNL